MDAEDPTSVYWGQPRFEGSNGAGCCLSAALWNGSKLLFVEPCRRKQSAVSEDRVPEQRRCGL